MTVIPRMFLSFYQSRRDVKKIVMSESHDPSCTCRSLSHTFLQGPHPGTLRRNQYSVHRHELSSFMSITEQRMTMRSWNTIIRYTIT